ncbi:hypothetical protein [Pseudanabaena sp. ABRG5-3]|uniref:hypothetical protein n=1 Tax=Pseudanabaena sp. ABRG5-3 TaxID=685565 RepID=UPI000DC6DE8A|nr:hypothetical protein [Pseudanabaena sp. ABRG5-3]BBC26719.1 hypothetical protein ABRG53_b006 [Pseudanabaena sp. ABRG5-3]
MVRQRDDWFPTPIWHFDIPNYEQLNKKLLQAIYVEKQKNNQGVSWSNGIGWHSKDYLHQRLEFQDIAQAIVTNALETGEEIGFDLKRFTMILGNCWAVINPKFAFDI